MIAVFKREFASLFQNVIGWLFCGVLLALYGLYFVVYNLLNGYPTLSYTITGITFLLLIAAPILTMRSLSEERKNRTDQLILTSPVSVFGIVVGKFLAYALCFTVVIGVICLSPLVMSRYGTVNFAQNYVSILGFWLYGCSCIAIGVFVSSLFESQIIAAVVSFAILFLGYMMSSLTGLASADDNIFIKILNVYDLTTPVTGFLSGNLIVKNIVYYVSLILLMLFLTSQVILKRRWSISAAKLSFSAFSLSAVIVAVVAAVVLNIGVSYLPEKYASLDVTTQKLYTASKEAKDYIRDLDRDITVYVLGTKGSVDDVVEKTLTDLSDESEHLHIEYVDPEKNPTFTTVYTQADLSAGSLIVVNGDKNKVIPYENLYESEFDYATYSSVTSGYDGEGQLVSAIGFVTSEDTPVVYQLQGHDETTISGSYSDVIEKSNMSLESLSFLTSDGVPAGADALLIHAPQTDFSTDDIAKLTAYLNAGGNVFLTLDFNSVSSLTNVLELLNTYGITVGNGIVADTDRDYYFQVPYYLLPLVETEEEFSDVAGNQSVLSPYTVALFYEEDNETCPCTPILTTSGESFLKEGITAENAENAVVEDIVKEEGDKGGPFAIGCKVDTQDGGDLFIFGSGYLFTESTNAYVSGRNAALFSDVIKAMIPEEESSVVIPVKQYELDYLLPSGNALYLYGILFSIVLPLGSILMGIIIWVIRRRR